MTRVAKEERARARGGAAQWPLSECGLPPRISRALSALHLRTVHDLHTARRAGLRGIGPGGLRTLDALLQLCDEIEAGAVQKMDALQIMERLLAGRSRELLALRYGLKSEFTPGAEASATLHEAGQRLGIVRERARQLESEARRILGTRPAQACLGQIRRQYEDCIDACGGIADGDEVRAAFPAGAMGGYHPAAFLRLCCDCQGWFAVHRGLFSRFSKQALQEAEDLALREVGGAQSLLTIRDLAERIPWPAALPASAHERILARLLPRVPGIAVTLRGEVIGAAGGLPLLLAAHLAAHGPSDAAALFTAINAALLPGGRRSKQAIAVTLRRDPRFVALPAGRYACAPAGGSIAIATAARAR